MSGKHDAVRMYRGHTLDFGRSQKRSEAWVWAAVLKGELEVVSSQGGAGSQHPRGEWPQQQGADEDLRGSQGSVLGSRCWRTPDRCTRKGCRKLGAYSWSGRQSAGCHAVAATVVLGGGSHSWGT